MGHNLHLAVISAETAKEACHEVEDYISDWGNADNWRTIGGCLSEDNKIYIHDKNSRYFPSDEDSNSINKLNHMFDEIIAQEDKSLTLMKKSTEALDTADWWDIKTMAEKMHEVCCFKRTNGNSAKFDILKNEYFSHQYNELGITHIYNGRQKTGKKFVAFIDMHS